MSQASFMGGGIHNLIDVPCYNNAVSCYNTLSGGLRNKIAGGCLHGNVIAGGGNTSFGRNWPVNNLLKYGNTISGYCGMITSTISGGQSNQIIGHCLTANHSTISGGYCNRIISACWTTGGNTPTQFPLSNSGYCMNRGSVISGGGCNQIDVSSTISTNKGFNVISGGLCNHITQSEYGFNVISGGKQNCTSESYYGYNTVGGGICNTISNDYGFIGGGRHNTISGYGASILGGQYNTIGSNGYFASILSGSLLTNDCNYSAMSYYLISKNLTGSLPVCADSYGTLHSISSDCRKKTSIQQLDYGLNTVMNLTPISFYWCENLRKLSGYERQLGFSAQEICNVVPETVVEGTDGYLGFDPLKLIPILVKSVQELKSCNDELKSLIQCANAQN